MSGATLNRELRAACSSRRHPRVATSASEYRRAPSRPSGRTRDGSTTSCRRHACFPRHRASGSRRRCALGREHGQQPGRRSPRFSPTNHDRDAGRRTGSGARLLLRIGDRPKQERRRPGRVGDEGEVRLEPRHRCDRSSGEHASRSGKAPASSRDCVSPAAGARLLVVVQRASEWLHFRTAPGEQKCGAATAQPANPSVSAVPPLVVMPACQGPGWPRLAAAIATR